MPSSQSGPKTNPFWSLFCSVRLTIVLLIILALASISGTLIPQQEEAARLAHSWSPGFVRVFHSLQLFDVYHSLWFRILIGLLALNLIICSLDRFPMTWKRMRGTGGIDRSRPFENLPEDRSFQVAGTILEVTERVAGFIKGRYHHAEVRNSQQECIVFGEKGRFSYFGVYLIHLSVLLILTGGIIGSLFGFEAFVNLPEGESTDTVFIRKTGEPRDLGFSVHCEKFTAVFYENGAPKEYRSDLTFLEEGRPVLRTPLLVNHPATFRGITFYQASYGSMPGNLVRLRIQKEGSENDTVRLEFKKGEPRRLTEGGEQIEVADIRSDFMKLGPAVLIHVQPSEGEPVHFWVFRDQALIRERIPGLLDRTPRFNPGAYKPYVFYLDQVEIKNYTGLQVNDDPGVLLVWIGCFAMILGFLVSFFTSHRRVWVRTRAGKGTVRVSVAGKANKNPVGMERELGQITRRLQGLLE